MSQNWIPPDITPICQDQLAPLTQCSPIGFMYLTLLSQLFGKSIDSASYPYQISQSYQNTQNLQDFQSAQNFQNVPSFGTSPAIETSIFGPTKIPLSPTELPLRERPFDSVLPSGQSSQYHEQNHHKNHALESHQSEKPLSQIKPIEIESTKLGTVFQTDYSINHETKSMSHGPEGSRGFSRTSFYIKSDPFSTYNSPFGQNPFVNEPSHYNYNNAKSFEDAFAEDSKVNVVKEQKQKGKNRKKRQAIEQYDFIIVGAGSAGCVIANRLSEVKKWKVLLIEAGPEEPEITSVPALAPVLGNSNIDWQYRTQPEEMSCRAQRGQSCSWLSGKVMGGSSAINYLVYMRGNKQDYDSWAVSGNKGWSYDDVLPYFKKSEHNEDVISFINNLTYHGIDGPLNVERFPYQDRNVKMLLQAFQENGVPVLDANGKYQLGTMITQTTSENGERASTNVAFIRPIRKTRKNLKIITNAQVTKVLIERNKKIAYGVKYFTEFDGWHEIHAVKEVILSAGALSSPKILMLSGIGPEKHLKSLNITVIKNLNVGQNLQDHVTTNAMLMKLSNKTSTQMKVHKILTSLEMYHESKHKSGPLSATGALQITAFIRTKYADCNKTVPDIQFHFDGRNSKDFYSDPETYLATNTLPFAYYDSINVRPILLAPKSRGYIALNKTDPIFGQPLIYPRFFAVRRDLDTLVAALKYFVRFEKTKAFQENGVEFIKDPVPGCTDYKWGTRAYFACLFISYTGTIYHPAGTCKMGPESDKNAVVDPRLRVYGIRHLRVADASIMPTIVRGNTNAPVIMFGEKVSDMIKEDWEHYSR